MQPGDCVVAFSRDDIFAIRREIENSTNHKCCVIYGTLPPETRSDQARRFNDPDSGYDILVASDAIGMGLNLHIRRIIFNTIYKSNGESIIKLDHSSVKQIAGRAGRRNSPYPIGEVTCRDPRDLQHIQDCLNMEIKPIRQAGLLPTAGHIEMYSHVLRKFNLSDESENLSSVLGQFRELATLRGNFFLCRHNAIRQIARHLDDINLPIHEIYTLCMGPVAGNDAKSMKLVRQFAQKRALGENAGIGR